MKVKYLLLPFCSVQNLTYYLNFNILRNQMDIHEIIKPCPFAAQILKDKKMLGARVIFSTAPE